MIKEFIIKLLFRLLDNNDTYEGIKQKRINQWLERQYKSEGFREYFRKRDLQLLKIFANGIEKDNIYWVLVGRRLELLKLLQLIDQKHKQKRSEVKSKNK